MDSIFDEDVDEVGGEIEAYCPSPRCKADTTHTIISMYEDEVRRVQCVVCGEVHAYRKPRGDAAEEAADAVPKRGGSRRATWEDALARASEGDLANCRPYSVRDTYEEGDCVFHPKFDVGFVNELLPDNKVEILFRDDSRILVHNRGDLASRMPDISETPAPREAKKKKRTKKPAETPQPIVLRGKADIDAAIGRARAAAQARTDEVTTQAETPASSKGAKKAAKPVKSAAPPKGKPPAKPVKAAKAPPPKAAKKPAKKPAAKPAKKPAAKKAPAKKPAKKPVKKKK
jgi:Zn ribbon nucleic-acid-binding protein